MYIYCSNIIKYYKTVRYFNHKHSHEIICRNFLILDFNVVKTLYLTRCFATSTLTTM